MSLSEKQVAEEADLEIREIIPMLEKLVNRGSHNCVVTSSRRYTGNNPVYEKVGEAFKASCVEYEITHTTLVPRKGGGYSVAYTFVRKDWTYSASFLTQRSG
jgi:hypothetical protein